MKSVQENPLPVKGKGGIGMVLGLDDVQPDLPSTPQTISLLASPLNGEKPSHIICSSLTDYFAFSTS